MTLEPTLSATERRQIRLLTSASRALTYARTLEEVAPLAARVAAELMSVSAGCLLRVEGPKLVVVGSHGLRAGDGTGPFSIDDAPEEIERTLGGRALAVPMVAGGRLTGVLATSRPADMDATLAEWLLAALADHVSLALDQIDATLRMSEATRERQGLALRNAGQELELRQVAHDLRTPLGTILHGVELLAMGDDPDAAPVLGRIRSAVDQMAEMMDRLADERRVLAGAAPLELGPVDVAVVVRAAVEPFSGKAAIRLAMPPSCVATADALRIHQILANLMENAVRYAPGSEVRVEVVQREETICVSVADEGPGILADEAPMIFEPYFRSRLHRDESGTGLGLSLARSLARQMKGELELGPPADRGCVVTLSLPRHGKGP